LLAAVLSTAFLLVGCSTPQVQDYAAETPVLELRDYFNGTLDAYGVFTDRSGKVVKRFTVVMDCTWKGDRACWTKPLPIPTAPPSAAFGG
jgi:hypothetical protein